MPAIHRSIHIQAALVNISSSPEIYDSNTNQWKAYDWLVNHDTFFVCPGDDNVIQRYVLALLYFSTSGDFWNKCSANGSRSICEYARFLSGAHECDWGGVHCDSSSHVISLRLDETQLIGQLPNEIGSLPMLRELDMDSNMLVGSIPGSLGQLEHLEVVDLDNNRLTGSIPVELYHASALRVLDLDHNRITGELSHLAADWTHLYYLQLDFNPMTGGIPSALGSLGNLKYVSLYNTSMTEPIPVELCNMVTEIYANCDLCIVEGCCTTCLES